jgi:glutaminyl-tRNA synthetase
MLMSKRFIRRLVEEGKVEGWDDPRLCTLAAVRRRGYTPEAIRKFCNDIGVSKADSTIDIAQLEQCVREDLQLKVPAINVVKNPIKVIIDNYPEDKIEMCTVENNSKVPEMGTREIPFGRELWVDGDDFMEVPVKKYFRLFPGNEVRFKGAYFITCNSVEKDADGNITCLHCTYDPETHSGSGFEGRKVKGTIHFVEASTAVKIRIREYGYLMKEVEEMNEETGKMETKLEFDPESLHETWGYAEPSVSEVKPGERFQFFRKGYYIADSKLTTDDEKVFNSIVGLKSSWK